ncbi:MAG: hypothetical protein M1835_004691 [Candelina submexicana]|nr:MAG: hypothetical protein M1835_004691 [Candelina submexicana]
MSTPAPQSALETHSSVPRLHTLTTSNVNLPSSNESNDTFNSASILESRLVDIHPPVFEDDEDGTGSETMEPLTPSSDTHPPMFHHHDPFERTTVDAAVPAVTSEKPLIINTAATPPPTTPKTVPTARTVDSQRLTSSAAKPRPQPAKRTASKSIRSLFRRSTSSRGNIPNTSAEEGYTDTSETLKPFSLFTSKQNTPSTSQSNTPPSPQSPTDTGSHDQQWEKQSSSPEPWTKDKLRSSTGLGLKEKGRIMFSTNGSQKPNGPAALKRSTSMTGAPFFKPDNSITRPAATGVGLKARRMSTSLPDDFTVDTVELNNEFTSGSKIPGKRKQVGKGATATVKLMVRKGGSDELYAVKEFRKKGQNENEDEYVKKVKSEYSIAKSLHHPNIVESIRLCTHSGRWNHVMEYCGQGELFALVEKRYFKLEDRLCLFKQLVRGVDYLHAHGIAHRDIKLENLLMTNEGHLKITDFGVSEVFCGEHPGLRGANGECGKNMTEEKRRCAPGICGSLPYIAPEVLAKQGDYDPCPLDVWSCAIVFLAMKYSASPWLSAEPKHEHYRKFCAGWNAWLSTHPDGVISSDDPDDMPKCGMAFGKLESPAMKRLMLRMLNPIPEKRIWIQDVMKDRWFKTIDCCSVGDYSAKETGIDAAGKKSCKLAAKASIKKKHNHLPPVKHTMPQYSFDMGDGY